MATCSRATSRCWRCSSRWDSAAKARPRPGWCGSPWTWRQAANGPPAQTAKMRTPAPGASRPALTLLRALMPQIPNSPAFPPPPLPMAGQQRAYWRQPASASALAWSIAGAARAHDGPLLAITRDNQAAHQLASDLHTLLGGDTALPVLNFPD